MMVIMPFSFLASYNIDLTYISSKEKLMIYSVMQIWGMNMFVQVCVNMITARCGTDDQRVTTCLMNGIACIFNAIFALVSLRTGLGRPWTGLGGSNAGILFNA